MAIPGRTAAQAAVIALLLGLVVAVLVTNGGQADDALTEPFVSAETPGERSPQEVASESGLSSPARPRADEADRGASRLGLFHTTADVEIWRARAQDGPYRVEHDAFPRSPGEWTEVEADAQTVREDPERHLWDLPDGDGCVAAEGQDMDTSEPRHRSRALAGAALYALVEADEDLAETVAGLLVAQTERSGVDFADRSRWCTPGTRDLGPVFSLTHAMLSQMLAYDLLPEGSLNARDGDRIAEWHLALAEVIDADIDDTHGGAFADRAAGDHELAGDYREARSLHWWYDGDSRMWWDSPKVDRLHNLYNNRWAAMARYQGLVGLAFGDDHHRDRATLFFREFVDYGVYPIGAHADMHRGFAPEREPEDVSTGLNYTTLAAVHAFTYAEALARAGDPTLYEYRSEAGAHGTEGSVVPKRGGVKSLRFLATTLARYADGTFDRYVTEDEGDEYRIDWEVTNSGTWSRTAILSGYYGDPDIRRLYRGDGEGMPEWPTDGQPHRWDAGDAGAFPAWMFWFADLEDRDYDPYR